MSETFSDTNPKIATAWRSLLRQVGPAQKLAMLGQLNQTVKTLGLSGLRTRHPDDSPEMLRRRLADLLLGSSLANKVYGPLVEKE
jgi:DNA-binding HxlR family transcriptional regulator